MEVKPKDFRVRLAFDYYSVGQLIQPTGLWRSRLLSLGYIEPIGEPDTPQTEPAGSGAETEKPKRRTRKSNYVNDSL